VCVLPLVIEFATRMRRIILPSVIFLTLPHFSTLSHKRHDLRRKKYWISNMCFGYL